MPDVDTSSTVVATDPSFVRLMKRPSYKVVMKRIAFLVAGAMMLFVMQSGAQSSIPTSGLQLWLMADAGVDTLNGTVNRWHDQSGNGDDAIQASASRQPSLVAGRLNGMPVVSFDGVNDKLGFTGSTHMTQFSLFLVINNHQAPPSLHGDGSVITFGANGDFSHQWFMIMRYPNTPDSIAMGPTDNSYVNAFSHNVAAYDQWRNLSIVTTGSVFNTTLRWDGNAAHMSLDGSDQAISVPLGDATGSGGGIGGADGVPYGTILAKCDVAEILVYNVALSNSARDTVESYLAEKWLVLGSVQHQDGNLPEKCVLEQNYPNPFNPTTVVSFQLPEASNVRLVVYDILGREVSVLVNERKAAGSYSVSFDARGMASGMYLYRLQAGYFVQTRKLLLLK